MNKTPTTIETKLELRWMIRKDMGDVLKLESACYSDPWTEWELIQRLRQKQTIGMVAEAGCEIVGYMVYDLCEEHIELVNFTVSPSYRRRRVGSLMLEKLVGKLTQKRPFIKLLVSERNLPAQLFFKRRGFRAIRVLRNYFGEGLGAYEMIFKAYSLCKASSH